MNKSVYQQINTIQQLLYKDFYIYSQLYFRKVGIALYWVLLTTFVSQLFLPSMGLHNYGPFILISSSLSYAIFITMHNATAIIDDLENHQIILYELTLPVPQWAIFIRYMISNSLQSLITTISLSICGYVMLLNSNIFPYFSMIKFITIFIATSLFAGSLCLIFATMIKNLHQTENIWTRVIFPFWYLGCYNFTWKSLYNISPLLAYINLLNPITLIMESGRCATINPQESLPFIPCCIGLIIYAIILGYYGIMRMKKRLDCI